MRGLINIIATIIFVAIMHACKTHMSTQKSAMAEYTDSLHKVSQVEATRAIEQWSAQKILSDAYEGAWTKLKVYDTSKPGNPLLFDLERKDSTKTHTEILEEDSTKTKISESSNEETEIKNDGRSQEIQEKDMGAEEQITSIGKEIAKIAFLLLIIMGLVELSKKF